MPGNRSIRRLLAVNALITCGVIVTLGIVFAISHLQVSHQGTNRIRAEVAAADSLRDIERSLLQIESRMKNVMLANASSEGALLLLIQSKKKIQIEWDAFIAHHRDGHDLSAGEAELILQFEESLPSLFTFLDRVSKAYQIYDPVELERLINVDWFTVQDGSLLLLRELTTFQLENAGRSRRALDEDQYWSAIIVIVLLAIGLTVVARFSQVLYRRVTGRVKDIENALDELAAGSHSVRVHFDNGETEMARIATAINRTVIELAERHQAINGLLERQRAILASAAEGIYGVDTDGNIMFINPAALATLGYSESEVLGQPSHALLHHHHPDGTPYPLERCPIYQARRTQQVVKCDSEVFFDKQGRSFPVEYTGAPFRDEQGDVGGIVIFRDVTARRAHEQQLKDTIAALRETNTQLSETRNQLLQAEKLAGIGQLAAGVAHEINNPIGFITSNLTSLEGYHKDIFALIDAYESILANTADTTVHSEVATLRTTFDIAFMRDDLDAMAAETRDGLNRVKRIVRDLLDFSRIESDADRKPTDLLKTLDSTLNIVRNSIKNKAEVVREFGPIPPVDCNEVQIQQVLMNLFMNAAHAIDSKGTITIGTTASQGEVCIEVSDTGCGMDADVVKRMFDPFYTTKPVGQGTGLGLSVSYSIIKNHGGRFEVDSIPGQGTHIRVYLPTCLAPAATPVGLSPTT